VKAVALGVALSVLSTTSGFCQTSSEQRTESFNLKKVQELDDFPAIVEHDVGDRRIRLMLTGYSAAPDGYEEKTTAFVSSLVRQLGGANTAIITSPTADKGSIDAIGTLVSQSSGAKVMYITSQDYVKYIDPSKFPEQLDKAAYIEHEKYVFLDNARYSVASTIASNAIVVTGGRDSAVEDTVNSIRHDNRVIIAEDLTNTPAWDSTKNRVNNAAAYMREQLASLQQTGRLKYPVSGRLTEEFLTTHKDKFLFVSNPEQAARALTTQGLTPRS
jgi:hypothetical protein